MLFELDSNNLNSKNLQILGVTSFMSHRSKIKIWGFLKMLWYFFQSKTNKTESRKRKKNRKASPAYLAHLAQQRRPSPKGQGRLLHQARQAGSSPPAAAWLPGSCLAAPRPPSSVVETPVFFPFHFPLA